MPKECKIYSVNEGNFNKFQPQDRQFIVYLKDDKKCTSRYIGSLVADFHRNLIKGGIFLYPATKKKNTDAFEGKLRLNFEAKPMAYLVEHAGGLAIDGQTNILDTEPASLHQRVPLFIGDKEVVNEYLKITKHNFKFMINYHDLGLVNTREMFKKAMKGGYAVPAYNFNNMEQLQAIIMACLETQSPVILQISKGAREYADQTLLRYMGQGAVEMMKRLAKEKKLKEIPVVLHLDHGGDFEICQACIANGFSSVMIDGSSLPYEENVALTKKVVEYAHKFEVTVEGELGVLKGVEDDVSSEASHYTRPEEAEDFVKKNRRGFSGDFYRHFARGL